MAFVTLRITACLLAAALVVVAWVPANSRAQRRPLHTLLEAGKDGYKFGDFTRSIGEKVTGNKDYKFGDISKAVDKQAKSKVNELTGKNEYKFGDLSKYLDSQAKDKVANFTGNSTYKVGDISKEVVRRAWAGEYDLEDMFLVIRVLLQMGASFTPMARFLPVKLLLELLNVGLAQDVGSKVIGKVATSLDERFKEAITGDAKYQLGDKTKDRLIKSLTRLTGKDSYAFGDISKVVAQRVADGSSNSNATKSSTEQTQALVDLLNNEALQNWDKKLLESRASDKSRPMDGLR